MTDETHETEENQPVVGRPTHIPFTGTAGSVYELVGGMETFRRLGEVLYRRIEADAALRAVFPEKLDHAPGRMALFLAQFFGGPQDYSARRGHPRLRMRHMPFRIGQAERDAWLAHMLAAMDEVGIEEPARTPMRRYFEDAATFLVNAPE